MCVCACISRSKVRSVCHQGPFMFTFRSFFSPLIFYSSTGGEGGWNGVGGWVMGTWTLRDRETQYSRHFLRLDTLFT